MFGGNAAAATKWLVEGYTRQKTKGNIRTDINTLSADECDLIADSLASNGESIKAKFIEHLQPVAGK